MIDIKKLIENPEIYKDSIAKRNTKNVDLDLLISVYNEKRMTQQKVEDLNAQINKISKSIGNVSADERKSVIEEGQKLKETLKEVEAKFKDLEEKYVALALCVPNTLPEDTPLGFEDNSNIEVRKFGEPTKFDFKPLDHVELGKKLDLLDFEAGAKTTGAKFYFFKNEVVMLENALKKFALDIFKEKGLYMLKTPDLARQDILMGSGFNPRGSESNVYNLEGMDLSLIATAEITIGGYLSNSVFKEEALPLMFAAESQCFRREAGGAGQENKGLYRVHQFDKMEMYAVTKPEDSNATLEKIVAIEEEIYQKLGLPYRVVRVCAGDLGSPAYKKFDIEAWMPGKGENGEYGEVTSASNCTDFQSRRLNIKYATKDKKEFAHTLNGTAIALSRVILAILENYQQKDGSVKIPEVLMNYVGFDEIKVPEKLFEDFKV